MQGDILRTYIDRFKARASRSFFETKVQLWNGRRRWFEAGTAFLEAPGEAPLLLSVLRDVTDRKRADVALRESEERYRQLFEANPHPMWVYDTETLQFRAVNEAATARYGYTAMSSCGCRFSICFLPTPPTNFRRVCVPSGTRRRPRCGNTNGRTAAVRDVQCTSHALRDGDRPVRLVLAIDVTERKRAEATLAERAQLAGLAAEVARRLAAAPICR